jgi:hypothetical protein
MGLLKYKPGSAINRAAEFRDQLGHRPRSIETLDRAGQRGKPSLMFCQIAARRYLPDEKCLT